ncbi:MAG: Gfo/Idh/MocA family oxidoreductase [Clostridia bacterium]|nr:Gfo/Idh/MocA family oxidoreductase [Clostridia bacterium]
MEKVRIAMVGYGSRGRGLLPLLLDMDDVEITGVCDKYEDRANDAAAKVTEVSGKTPFCTTDYRRLLERDDVDAIITPSDWREHVDICINSMLAGKRVATEVGGAYSLEQLYELVRTSERTGIPCMMLENCCYGREEMTVTNMVRQGIFGTVVCCEGGYHHDLRGEITAGRLNRHYRQRNYLHRNGELYPTHSLGPIAKLLDINRGNRFLTLVSVASSAHGLDEYVNLRSPDGRLSGRHFTEGDVVTTIIKCARGETIVLTHDTTLPRPYSRAFTVHGTKAIYLEDRNRGMFVDGRSPHGNWDGTWETINDYYDEFEHPLWRDYRAEGVKKGHDGIDWLCLSAFVESVAEDAEPPIDVYDTAAWMSVTCLSEQSAAMGGAPVPVPDFTNGKWLEREPERESKYMLSI